MKLNMTQQRTCWNNKNNTVVATCQLNPTNLTGMLIVNESQCFDVRMNEKIANNKIRFFCVRELEWS